MKTLANGELEFGMSEGIARLRLNRPAKANSISMAMLEAIVDICRQLADNGEIKALVVSAAGKSFSGGVDLAIMDGTRTPPEVLERYLELWDQMIQGFQKLPFLVIGVIQGPAIAGGLSISFACHLRIASTEASFGYPRVPQGHAPGRHNLTNLVDTIGAGRARLVLLGARILSAREAADWGLIDLLVGSDQLEAELESFIDKIRATPLELGSITNRLIADPKNERLWNDAANL
jgi:enoyl-CoA hydratase